VSGISPSSGAAAGGTVVTITGSGLDGDISVIFEGAGNGTITADSGTQITVTSPPGTGTVSVTVYKDVYSSYDSAFAGKFTYIPSGTQATPSPSAGLSS
jgi:hypothetical protein